MLTNDTKLYLRRLHEEAQGEVPGSKGVDPEYRNLAHALLSMFETLLDPEEAYNDFANTVMDEEERVFDHDIDIEVRLRRQIYGEYEALRDEIHDVFDNTSWDDMRFEEDE